MVADNIKNAGLYKGLGKRIETALNYLQETDFSKMEPGKYEIDGSSVFALVQEYETIPLESCSFEAHRKYLDIQYMAQGGENMGYAHIGQLKVSKEYNPAEDCLLLSGTGSNVLCPAGTFMIFGPEDAHMPRVAAGAPAFVKKVVVKVAV